MALLWPWIPMPCRTCCPALKQSQLGSAPWAGASFDWDVIFSPLSSESSLLFPLIKCLLSLALLAQKVSATSSVPACTDARGRKESFCLSDSVRRVQTPKCVPLSFFPHCCHCGWALVTPTYSSGGWWEWALNTPNGAHNLLLRSLHPQSKLVINRIESWEQGKDRCLKRMGKPSSKIAFFPLRESQYSGITPGM